MINFGSIKRSLTANLGNQALNIALQLLTVPIFLMLWTQSQYASWLILTTVPAYLATTDLGFLSAASNRMSALVAKGELGAAANVFRTAVTFCVVATGGVCIALATFLTVVDVRNVLPLAQLTKVEATTALWALIAYSIVAQLQLVIHGAFRASGRNATSVMIATMSRLVETSAAIVVASLGGSVVHACIALASCRALIVFIEAACVSRLSEQFKLRLPSTPFTELKLLARPSLAFLSLPIGNLLSLQGALIVLGHVAPPAAVVTFATTRTVARLGIQLVTALESSIWPELSFAYGRNDYESLRSLHRNACALTFYTAATCGAIFAIAGPFAISLWTDDQIAPGFVLCGLLAADLVVNALWSTSAVLPAATNRLGRVASAYILATAASLLAMPSLIAVMGIAGAAIVLLAADLILVPVVLRYSLRLLSERPVDFAAAFSVRRLHHRIVNQLPRWSS